MTDRIEYGSMIDDRTEQELDEALKLVEHTVYKRYMSELDQYPVLLPNDALLQEEPHECSGFFRLKKITYKKGEDIHLKLSTVYNASVALGGSLAIMIDVKEQDAPADIYMGIHCDLKNRTKVKPSLRTLEQSLKSNFPGSQTEPVRDISEIVDGVFDHAKFISSVSCVAAQRDNSKTTQKEFIQGIERFIDTMGGNTYTVLFIAEPISDSDLAKIKSGYESIYNVLSPYCKSVWSFNENESKAILESTSRGITESVTEGTSKTQGHTLGAGLGIGINSGITNSSFDSISGFTDNAKEAFRAADSGRIASKAANAIGLAASAASSFIPVVGAVVTGISIVGSLVTGLRAGDLADRANSIARQDGQQSFGSAIANAFGLNGGLNINGSINRSKTSFQSTGTSTSDTSTKGTTDTEGSGKTLQIERENKTIQELLKIIDKQIERTKQCEDYGTYNCGAYFISSRQESNLLAANTYRALMMGDGSSVESSVVNSWKKKDNEDIFTCIKEYLKHFTHPILFMPLNPMMDPSNHNQIAEKDLIMYTPGTIVSGRELPLHLGLPMRSVYGLPVIEHAEFGRNVFAKEWNQTDVPKLPLGRIYHMGQLEKGKVELDINSLAMHTFITGSTGSGKSNTIFTMLDRLTENDVKFLVIEPAKGEYKSVFGGRSDVSVYGTNPNQTGINLLRLNPFRFPKNIHVLEHIDRLVEIFNVCWPMYAAMPAILKDSVERAYASAGWDMVTSTNRYDDRLFPTFNDVLREIKNVLDESDYSADNKSDYTGSLVTRLRSLTNGINGLIFTSDDISDHSLFDENTIIDLSRIGSTETKALIMGVLVLKLQEHRMDASIPNSDLRHVTVLEEAHNLLKRTSSEQIAESSNLLGKAVEMLANSIAEMRTYGEGFIIADQSPGLLDMSVIRNTNTKIIMRLPDLSDRELVGKAAGLNDFQIEELTRLERGVAAVYQNEWVEAVLCRIDKHTSENKYVIPESSRKSVTYEDDDVSQSLLDCIMTKEIYRKNDRVDIQILKDRIIHSKLDSYVKCEFFDYINADEDKSLDTLRKLVYDFLDASKAVDASRNSQTLTEWVHSVADHLSISVNKYSKEQIDLVMALLIYEQSLRDSSYNDILRSFAEMHQKFGGVY